MKYSIGTSKGRFDFDKTCFGGLSHLPFCYGSHESVYNYGSLEYRAEAEMLASVRGCDFQYIEFPLTQFYCGDWEEVTGLVGEDLLNHVESEVIHLLNDLKIYEGIWSHEAETHSIRVYTNHPYDQIMTLLFLIRNIIYMSNFGRTYATLRSKGYSPIVSAITSNIAIFCKSHWTKKIAVSEVGLGEYNWVNPCTFTKSDFIKLINQEPVTWFGTIWNESPYGGYQRDHHFEDSGIIFRELAGDEDEDDYDEDDYDSEGSDGPYPAWNGPYYHLVDVFSSATAEFVPPFSIQVNAENGGFVFEKDNYSVEEFIEVLDTLLKEIGAK